MGDRKDELDVVVVDSWNLAKLEPGDSERRVLDVELGGRLGVGQARDIRKFIKRHEKELLKIGTLPLRATVARIEIGPVGSRTGFRECEVQEYWLNKDQALYIALKSQTAKANEITISLIKAFNELQAKVEELQLKLNSIASDAMSKGKILLYVAPDPIQRGQVWDWDLADELSRLYGHPKPNREEGWPQFLAGFTRWIYNRFPAEVISEVRLRAKAKKARRHQLMTDLLMQDLKTLQTMLRMALSSPSARTVDDVKAHIEYAIAKEIARKLGIESMLSSGIQCQLIPCGMCSACGTVNQAKAHFCQHCGKKIAA